VEDATKLADVERIEISRKPSLRCLTPEFSGRSPTHWDMHFIVHGRCNEMLGITTYHARPQVRPTTSLRSSVTMCWFDDYNRLLVSATFGSQLHAGWQRSSLCLRQNLFLLDRLPQGTRSIRGSGNHVRRSAWLPKLELHLTTLERRESRSCSSSR